MDDNQSYDQVMKMEINVLYYTQKVLLIYRIWFLGGLLQGITNFVSVMHTSDSFIFGIINVERGEGLFFYL